jgi:hypothetical protein
MSTVQDGDTWGPRVQGRRGKGVLEIPRKDYKFVLEATGIV